MTHGRRDQILDVLQRSGVQLDDDQIAEQVRMNRVYVNALCRQLAADGLILRRRGSSGKLVNVAVDEGRPVSPTWGGGAAVAPRANCRPSSGRNADRIGTLVADFSTWVTAFESSQAFPGPSLYFHQCAIEQRRRHRTVGALLGDIQFLEYVYAVLPAWGMHRMGPQAAKVGDFAQITAALRDKTSALEQLWPLWITTLDVGVTRDVAAMAWNVITHIRVSTSQIQIVAGSKFLHHLLPDLIVPIDRRYTAVFFGGYVTPTTQQSLFLDWFPKLASIGARCRDPILDAIRRGGFMATGEAKVIDNAIIGFTQARRTR